MKAAVVTSFDRPPRYGDFEEPVPGAPGEAIVDVLAAGLHHITRGRASGTHYSAASRLPFVPGTDGVGRGADGRMHYFVQGPGDAGTMADRTVIRLDHSIELPADSDPVAIAAAMNPAMASWLALRCRVPFRAGHQALILGATGGSGSMAVQVARHLGASQIIAAGRDERKLAKLPVLGATDVVRLDDARLATLAHEVDFVLDLVWGESSARIMEAVLRRRTDRGQPLTWIHVGSMAGEVAPIPGALLRAAKLHVVGSGLGSVSSREILAELPALVREIARGTLRIGVRAVPLSEVERAWSEEAPDGERIVFTP